MPPEIESDPAELDSILSRERELRRAEEMQRRLDAEADRHFRELRAQRPRALGPPALPAEVARWSAQPEVAAR